MPYTATSRVSLCPCEKNSLPYLPSLEMTAAKRSLMHPHPQAETRHKSLQTQMVTHCSWLHKGQMGNNLLRISANLIAQSVFHSNLFRWQHNHSLSNWTTIPRVKHTGISQKKKCLLPKTLQTQGINCLEEHRIHGIYREKHIRIQWNLWHVFTGIDGICKSLHNTWGRNKRLGKGKTTMAQKGINMGKQRKIWRKSADSV